MRARESTTIIDPDLDSHGAEAMAIQVRHSNVTWIMAICRSRSFISFGLCGVEQVKKSAGRDVRINVMVADWPRAQ
jgi:hypothetical protein